MLVIIILTWSRQLKWSARDWIPPPLPALRVVHFPVRSSQPFCSPALWRVFCEISSNHSWRIHLTILLVFCLNFQIDTQIRLSLVHLKSLKPQLFSDSGNCMGLVKSKNRLTSSYETVGKLTVFALKNTNKKRLYPSYAKYSIVLSKMSLQYVYLRSICR